MTNADIINCKDVTSLNDEMSDFIRKNYAYVDVDKPVPPAVWGYKWETACKAGNDWKYGRYKICRDKMLRRRLTFNEFYGGGIVD